MAIKFDLFNNSGEGPNSTGLYTDGAYPSMPAINLNGTGINLHSGDYFNATLIYNGTTLTMTLTDAHHAGDLVAVFHHQYPCDRRQQHRLRRLYRRHRRAHVEPEAHLVDLYSRAPVSPATRLASWPGHDPERWRDIKRHRASN